MNFYVFQCHSQESTLLSPNGQPSMKCKKFFPSCQWKMEGLENQTQNYSFELCNKKICADTKEWIDFLAWCDGTKDCLDGSDETNCDIICPSTHNTGSPPLGATDVTFSIDVVSIPDINANDQRFSAEYNLGLEWEDPRVSFCNIRRPVNYLTSYELKRIWTPNIRIQKTQEIDRVEFDSNAVASYNNTARSENNRTCPIEEQQGILKYTRSYQSDFICTFDLTWFPFDTQNCSMNFISLTNNGHEVRLIKGRFTYTGADDLSRQFVRNQFFIINRSMKAKNTERASIIEVEFVLQRSLDNIFVSKFLPTLLLNIIGHAMTFLNEDYFETSLTVNLTVMLVLATM